MLGMLGALLLPACHDSLRPRVGPNSNNNIDVKQGSQLVKDLLAWDAIEDHRTGSVGDLETAQWLADEIRATGLLPDIDAFPFSRRVLGDCSITVGDQRIPGVPLFDGSFTSSDGLRGKLGQSGERGSIALVEFTPQVADDAEHVLYQVRDSQAHPAVVAVAAGTSVAPGLALMNADRYQQPYGVPVLQVATEHSELLARARAQGLPVSFVAHATTQLTQAQNIQVRVAGRNPKLPPLVVMTPRSAWWTCTAERGGGIAAWLACIRLFAQQQPERDVLFTANTGHELGHVGLDAFLEANPRLVRSASAWIHLGANFAAHNGTVVIQASSDAHMQLLQLALAEQQQTADVEIPVAQRPFGEARNIYDGGGQYVSLLGSNPLFHHPDDRWPNAIDLPRAQALIRSMLNVTQKLAQA
jgi:hypothetical protein